MTNNTEQHPGLSKVSTMTGSETSYVQPGGNGVTVSGGIWRPEDPFDGVPRLEVGGTVNSTSNPGQARGRPETAQYGVRVQTAHLQASASVRRFESVSVVACKGVHRDSCPFAAIIATRPSRGRQGHNTAISVKDEGSLTTRQQFQGRNQTRSSRCSSEEFTSTRRSSPV